MSVRAATDADAQCIVDIVNPVIRDTPVTFTTKERSTEDVIAAIADAACFLVVEHEGKVVGFLSFDQFRKGPGYARTMEHSIVLAPAAQGFGLGRELMTEALNQARAAGVGSLWAGVSAENPAGVAFHSRIGFEKVAVLPKVGFKFGRWMDLVLMRKWLLDAE